MHVRYPVYVLCLIIGEHNPVKMKLYDICNIRTNYVKITQPLFECILLYLYLMSFKPFSLSGVAVNTCMIYKWMLTSHSEKTMKLVVFCYCKVLFMLMNSWSWKSDHSMSCCYTLMSDVNSGVQVASSPWGGRGLQITNWFTFSPWLFHGYSTFVWGLCSCKPLSSRYATGCKVEWLWTGNKFRGGRDSWRSPPFYCRGLQVLNWFTTPPWMFNRGYLRTQLLWGGGPACASI